MASVAPELERSLETFAAQYFQVVEPLNLTFPSGEVLIKPEVQQWVYQNMFNETTVWPVPPVGYRNRVLKTLLSKIEDSITDPEHDEISDDLMNSWSDLITRPRRSPLEAARDLSYIKYTPPRSLDSATCQSIITSENRGLILSSGITGFRTWEAALHLATYLSTPAGRAVVSGRNVVELGAGTGLISMYCLKCLDSNSVVATDREPTLISNIQDCVARNNLDPTKFHTCIWEWGRPSGLLDDPDESRPTSFDVALGADLTYDVDLVPVLLLALRDLFDNYGVKEFFISASLRNQETFTAFLKSCETNSFHTEPIDFCSPPREAQEGFFHNTDVPIKIYRITAG